MFLRVCYSRESVNPLPTDPLQSSVAGVEQRLNGRIKKVPAFGLGLGYLNLWSFKTILMFYSCYSGCYFCSLRFCCVYCWLIAFFSLTMFIFSSHRSTVGGISHINYPTRNRELIIFQTFLKYVLYRCPHNILHFWDVYILTKELECFININY